MFSGSPKKPSDVLRSLHGFLLEDEADVEGLSIERVRALLKAEKIDTRKLVYQVQEILIGMAAKNKLYDARKRLQVAMKLIGQFRKLGTFSAKKANEMRDMLDKNPEAVATVFRKFQELKDKDKLSVLEDLAILEEITKSDANHRSA